MKALKALEILKEIEEEQKQNKFVFEDGSYYKQEYLHEAISELEALQTPKTCDQCENHLKERTVLFYDKKVPLSQVCKYGAGSFFKSKDNQ